MTSGRRPADVPVHEWHHRLIDERTEAWRQAPRRSGVDRLLRGRLAKQAQATVVGHLRGQHGRRGNLGQRLIDDLLVEHDRIHVETSG